MILFTQSTLQIEIISIIVFLLIFKPFGELIRSEMGFNKRTQDQALLLIKLACVIFIDYIFRG